MDALSTEKKREIVRLVFPDLRYGGDPDIDRYFELRKGGRMVQALSIYNGALRVRYPDDSARVLLLKLYRENDPRYASCQEGLVLDFAAKLSLRIRSNIDLIVAPLEKADLSDALRALKAVESVLSRLPGESEGALDLLTRYDRFAQVLGHRGVLVSRALELVREYDAVSRADRPSDYDFVARSAAIEERRRASIRPSGASGRSEENYDFVSRSASLEHRRKSSFRQGHSYFDPARIKFSEADRARVEISPALVRREDKVLALCAKYWPQARDEAFERIVFLYSRKFGGRHFEVFRAIKLGRAHGSTDDEILSAVAAILTTSYSYSVSGDLYMQIMWRRLRKRMDDQVVAERLSLPGPESKVRARRAASAAPATAAPPAALPKPTVLPKPAASPSSAAPGRAAAVQAAAASAPPAAPPQSSRAGRGAPAQTPSQQRAATQGSALIPAQKFTPPPLAPVSIRGFRGPELTRAAAPRAAAAIAEPQASQPPVLARAESRAAELRAARAPLPPAEPKRAAPERSAAEAGTITRSSGDTAAAEAGTSFRPSARAKGGRLLERSPSGPEPIREIRASHGSISDSIRKLSGRNYDVYKEIFLERVRDHIRRRLLASQSRSHGLFDTAANEAEDQVFGFIKAHYDDPFMDWEHSAERDAVEALGFAMPSLAPIVESCFRKL